MKGRIREGLEKIVEVGKNICRIINKNKARIVASLILPFIFTKNIKSGSIGVDNRSDDVWFQDMYIKHVQGATEGHDGNYDGRYLESPNPLHIYSHNYYNGVDYMIDARGANSTTTYNLHLKNIGFSGIANNYLRFKLYNSTNFEWKNIFLGDANDSNDIVADIKYVINNGGVYPNGTHYGNFPLPDVDGSNVGVYDMRKVFFFNHADLNRDKKVDIEDLEIFTGNWGRDERVEPNDPKNTLGVYVGKEPNDLDAYSDINRDGVVNFNDFAEFSQWWHWDANDPNTYSKLTPKVDGINVLGEHLKAFQNSLSRLFFGRNEPLYAKEENESA